MPPPSRHAVPPLLALLLAPLAVLPAAPAAALIAGDNHRAFPRDGGDDQMSVGYVELDGDRVFDDDRGAGAPYILTGETVNGIAFGGRIDFLVPNGTTTADTKTPNQADYVYARTLLSLTNTGPADTKTLEVAVHTGGGVHGHISAAGEGWHVMEDQDDGGAANTTGTRDPAVGILWSNGLGAVAPAVSSDTEAKEWTFIEMDLDFDVGETKTVLIFLASRNETDSFPQTASTARSQADVLALLADPELMFSGLSAAERAAVVNFGAAAAVPLPGALGLLAMGLGGFAAAMRRRR